jgi:peptidoglycan/xylan/chitin deacetylase (PgdA/CDA1 family)
LNLESALFRGLGSLLSPAGHKGKLAILIYHRILSSPDPLLHDEIDAPTFERHMRLIAANFNVLRLGEACERLERSALPARAVSITFDDGYADNELFALPVLKRSKLPAAFFISTAFSAGGIMFNDIVIETVRRAPPGNHDLSKLGLGTIELDALPSRRAAVERLISALKHRRPSERQSIVDELPGALRSPTPKGAMMTPDQVAKLHREGMEIGAHTVNHPILASLSDDEARSEIVASKRILEEITDAPVVSFAYPNGKPGVDYTAQHVRLVREAGFRAAVSTLPGVAHRGSDIFQLPRFGPWDRNPRRLGLRLMASCVTAVPSGNRAATSAMKVA